MHRRHIRPAQEIRQSSGGDPGRPLLHDHDGRRPVGLERADAGFEERSSVVVDHDGPIWPDTVLSSPGEPKLPSARSALKPSRQVISSPRRAHTGVGDRHLVNAVAPAQHLRRDLGLEVEPVGDDGETFEHLRVEQLEHVSMSDSVVLYNTLVTSDSKRLPNQCSGIMSCARR